MQALKCEKCGALFIPPRYACLKCGSDSFHQIALEGSGVIQTYTTIHVPPTRFAGGAYRIAVIRLDEGVHVTARLLGEEEKVKIGAKVTFIKKDDVGYWFRT